MTNETDILMTTSKFSRADEDALSTKDENDDRDETEIPNAQKSPKANLNPLTSACFLVASLN